MTLDVVVLGSAGTHPGPGRACAGFLLRTATTQVLLDCGNGSTANLQRVTSFDALDAIVVSHRHPDHCADLIGTYYALRFHPDGPRTVDVYAPPGTEPFLAQLLSDDSAARFGELLRFHDVAGGDHVTVGDLALSFHHSPHAVPTVAVRAEHDGAVVAYSGDTGGGPGVIEAARGADLFLCEATWLGDADDWPSDLHLTATGAGELAAEAAARRLALVHVYPSNPHDEVVAAARRAFDGPVELPDDMTVYELDGG